jgi:hypothetical protein
MDMRTEPDRKPWWQTRGGVALVGFVAIAGFFLLTEHTAHVFGVLPYVLILACPLLHFFMHSRHHKGGGSAGADHHEHPHPKSESTNRGEP